MLKRKNRLTTKEINGFGKSKKIHSKYFMIMYKEAEVEDESKIAIVVSKKVAKKAVERNKIKRRVREILKEWLKQNARPICLMIYTKKGVGKLSFSELKRGLLSEMKGI